MIIKGVNISNLPEKIEDEKPEEDSIILRNTEVNIRALDRDNADSGWSAIVPAFSSTRTKLLIDKSISLEKLASSHIVNADVLILYTTPKPATQKPKEYTIKKIYE